ncbi:MULTISPECIES: DUF485 domain-containing protein [Helicobacter]|uniref:Inner membrane protein yjcH n=2 Tax=Helicobacter TaxID=209 RepID=A0A377J4Z1_9HELI|nr:MULTISPECIES: DUF485 domain-containing protein [Helicobacter]MDL0079822.1 DUF485 domain-containing protein [Helicobacter sp. CPD2-1]MDL0082082.1 DUF485 domain-containing protein [Helicobacter sp. XJK30-2]STO97324.1 Inner membrane protein yjcH [Helicobacter canis]
MGLKENQQNALSKFRQFVSFRNKISLVLSLVVLVCYYIFVLSVGLFPEVLGYRLGPSSVTLGIIGGLFIIVLSIVVTGIYTFLANTYFDRDQANILNQLQESNLIKDLQNGEIDYKNQQGGAQ